jgi:hypothetical protein
MILFSGYTSFGNEFEFHLHIDVDAENECPL